MEFIRVSILLLFGVIALGGHTSAINVWSDVWSCVQNLSNDTTSGSGVNPPESSMIKMFSAICGNKDAFVRCLDNSLKQNTDPMAQMVGSLFNVKMVTHAYEGLCTNISAIERSGTDVMSCLTTTSLESCQREMADYYFYMSVIKKFAPPSDQLSRTTVETLLCSVTSQRRQCEVEALRKCNPRLGDVMQDFYQQTRPDVCVHQGRQNDFGQENKIL